MGVVSLASGPSGFAKTEVGLVDLVRLVRPVGQLCLVALLRLVGHEGPGVVGLVVLRDLLSPVQLVGFFG